MKLSNNTL